MSGSIRRRGSAFELRVYLGADPQTGKKRYKSLTFPTYKDADSQRVKMAVHPAIGAGVGPWGNSRLRLGDYLQSWLRTSQLAESERRARTSHVKRLVNELGQVPLARLHPATIDEFFARRREAGTNPTTDSRLFRLLRTALNRALAMGLISANPCEHIVPPRPGEYMPTIWTLGELAKFLDAAREKSRHLVLYATMVGTGLRPGEILALRWRDLDLDAGQLRVMRVLERPKGGGFRFRDYPKTKKSRRAVRLPDALVTMLRWTQSVQEAQRAVAGGQAHELVFRQENGKPIHEHNLMRRDFGKLVRNAGLPKARLYDLRHMHLTYLTAANVPLKAVQERAGHSSAAFTQDRYIHMVPSMQDQAAQAAQRLLTSTGGDKAVEGVPDE